jgi:hypothetical protein
MFKKIVSNLPFSPALIGQLGFYSKRLRQEEATRRLGLIFVALALVVQSIAVFQPPESANASSSTDMVNGGITSLHDFLTSYDANAKHVKDVMNYVGITRSEISATTYTTFRTGNRISWGFASRFSYAQGEREHNILNSQGKKLTTVYSRPLKLWGSASTKIGAWVGNSKKMGWFAIMKSCGNLVTETLPPKIIPPTPPTIPLLPKIVKSKTATNTSQGFVDASSVTSRPGDQISYTITIENTGLAATTEKLEENLEDVLQYSTLVDKGGGTYNDSTKILSWLDVTLKPKDKQTRTFVVKVLNTIPATATGSSDPTSFDCVMTNVFGNSISVKIVCPTPKIVETVVNELPTTGPTENMFFAGIVFSMAAYFYARTRQVKKEVYLIRRDTSSGTI